MRYNVVISKMWDDDDIEVLLDGTYKSYDSLEEAVDNCFFDYDIDLGAQDELGNMDIDWDSNHHQSADKTIDMDEYQLLIKVVC